MEDKMGLAKILLAALVCSVILLDPIGDSALAETAKGCNEPKTGTKEVPIFSPPLASVVTGVGRLQFYSAPSYRCTLDGVFVIPKDELIAYVQTSDGRSSVMYVNPRTGNNASGWVRSARLRETGAIAPKQ
jgi:hypothetical protein